MWDSIRQNLANWLSDTALGQSLGLNPVFLAEYLWLIPFLAVVLVLIARRLFTGHRSVSSGFDTFAGTAFIVIVMVVIGFVMLIIADIAGWDDDYKEAQAIKGRGYACSKTDDFNNVRVGSEGLRIVLCGSEVPITIFSRKRLGVVFDVQFQRKYGEYLGNEKLDKYVRLFPPMSYRGSIATSWKIVPQQGITGLKKAGLDHVIIRVIAE